MAENITVTKIDDTSIEVSKPMPAVVRKFDIKHVKERREFIVQEMANFKASKDKELAELNIIIEEAKKLGIT